MALKAVVLLEVVEQSLLVTEVKIVLEVIVDEASILMSQHFQFLRVVLQSVAKIPLLVFLMFIPVSFIHPDILTVHHLLVILFARWVHQFAQP